MKSLIIVLLLGIFALAIYFILRGANSTPSPEVTEHAVMVAFDYGSTDLGPLFKLEDQLKEAIEAANAGEFDGNEIAVDGSDGSLFMYGPNADRLFEAIRPVLETTTVIRNIKASLRYGPPEDGVRRETISISQKE